MGHFFASGLAVCLVQFTQMCVCVLCARIECILVLNGYLCCVGPRCIFGPVHSDVCVCVVCSCRMCSVVEWVSLLRRDLLHILSSSLRCVCVSCVRVECVLLVSGHLHHVRAPLRILLSFFRSVGVSRGSMGVLFFKRV